ncbi:hypothetical protein [Streptacidiphilus cavernicola]|uniref:Leucyl aminopeptidase n=1 Tax=Streptacidiphilus cavernicola TaxID=3342716 RepID=A0ABV6W2B0_9ACTN
MEITFIQGDITEQRVDAVVGWPLDDAARIAVRAVGDAALESGSGVEEARFVLFGVEAYQAFDSVRLE